MKKIAAILLASIVAICGCTSLDVSALESIDPGTVTGNITQDQAVAIAQNWLGNSNVVAWVNALLSNQQLMDQLESVWDEFGGAYGAEIPDALTKCTKASCWNGANASQRMMNILSPGMSADKFASYVAWMKGRDCNAAHVFLSNKADGENAGYCIYGNSWDWTVDDAFVSVFKQRISALRKEGFGVFVWLFADDSSEWNKTAKANFAQYLADLKSLGLLDEASAVVVGLELGEYYSRDGAPKPEARGEVMGLVAATRTVFPGVVGTHESSGKTDFSDLGDLVMLQANPGKSSAWLVAEAARVKAKTGKPVNFFEFERSPARSQCEALLNSGHVVGCGNW